MKQRYEKSARVLQNLMGFCHLIGATEFRAELSLLSHLSVIRVEVRVDGIEECRLEELRVALGMPRQHEVEQYYWNISTEGGVGDELTLTGMMVDRSDIAYENGVLTIRCEREEASLEE